MADVRQWETDVVDARHLASPMSVIVGMADLENICTAVWISLLFVVEREI
jgi:hypothetical protein